MKLEARFATTITAAPRRRDTWILANSIASPGLDTSAWRRRASRGLSWQSDEAVARDARLHRAD